MAREPTPTARYSTNPLARASFAHEVRVPAELPRCGRRPDRSEPSETRWQVPGIDFRVPSRAISGRSIPRRKPAAVLGAIVRGPGTLPHDEVVLAASLAALTRHKRIPSWKSRQENASEGQAPPASVRRTSGGPLPSSEQSAPSGRIGAFAGRNAAQEGCACGFQSRLGGQSVAGATCGVAPCRTGWVDCAAPTQRSRAARRPQNGWAPSSGFGSGSLSSGTARSQQRLKRYRNPAK